jgi:PAS domain S-box-containing protein
MEVLTNLEEANHCIRELLGLTLLPAIWSGGQAKQIRECLADGLQNSLHAEVVYVRASENPGEVTDTAFRLGNNRSTNALKEDSFRKAIEAAITRTGVDVISLPLDDKQLRLAVMTLGPGQEFGVIAVGSTRPDFPTSVERLLLNVGVNQAIIAFRSAKQAAALRRSESNLRDFFENATVGLHWVNSNGIIVWANQTELDLLGYAKDEYVGRHIREFHADACVIEDILGRLTRGDTLNEYEARLRAKDGSIRHVLINSNVLFENGKFIHTRCFTRDISERKKAEIALIEAAEQRRLAIEAASLGAWDYRFSTGDVFWDERCRNMWGIFEGTQLDYNSVLERIHQEDREGVQNAVDEALAGVNQGQYRREFRVIWPDGSEHWIASQGQVYFNNENDKLRPIRFIGITREITEEKRATVFLEQTVQDRTAKLKETIAELEGFSYSISHDMRSPLRAMQGYADALLEKYDKQLDEDGARYLKRIQRGAKRLDLLIQDVLAYSKVAKGSVSLNEVSLEGIIRDAIRSYPQLQLPQVTIAIRHPLPKVWGHEAYLTQIFSNLLGNAIKFVPPAVAPIVRVWAETEGELVRVWIEDNGIGIDPRHHADIFQIFGRVYSEKDYEGTGIGLSIVKKAAERMGGSVGVLSELGKGSRFWVTLKQAL